MLVDRTSFNSLNAGTGQFIFGTQRSSFRSLVQAGISDGSLVSYLAQDSLVNTQQAAWGHGVYSAPANTVSRDPSEVWVVGAAAGSGPLNFTVPPIVSLTLLASDIRSLLTSAANYYVEATGSDVTGNGSAGHPWATLTHASRFLAENVDGNNQVVTLNVGSGSFQGAAILPIVNALNVQVIGAGSANTTILDGPNDGIANFGEALTMYPTLWGVNNLTLHSNLGPGINVFGNSVAGYLGDSLFSNPVDLIFRTGTLATNGVGILNCSQPAVITAGSGLAGDNITVIMNGNNPSQGEILLINNCIFNDFAAWTVQGTPDTTTWLQCIRGAKYIVYSEASMNKVSNTPYPNVIKQGGLVGVEGRPLLGPSYFPGNGTLVLDSPSSYDGFYGSESGAGVPTTTQFPDPGSGGYYVDTNTGNVYDCFNQGGTLKKVQLI